MMQYVNPTFTTPTSNGRLSDIEYEIAVGILCPTCKQRLEDEHESPFVPHTYVCAKRLPND